MPASPGDIIEGQVAKLLKYGAIIQLDNGETGLVHISEIANEFVKEVGDYLREGDRVIVKALARKDPSRLELSVKQAAPGAPSGPPPPRRRSNDEDFERRLDDFMKRSNQVQSERRRGREPRRRGG